VKKGNNEMYPYSSSPGFEDEKEDGVQTTKQLPRISLPE
jgi:hypothetical protein